MIRKTLIALFLLFSISAAFCASPYDPYKTQTISGFVDDISYLYVSPFRYEGIVSNGYEGINLDYTDTTNDERYLIQPTDIALSSPGLQIGTFSILSTFIENTSLTSVKLVISHTKLIHSSNTTDAGKLDYELGVMYSLSNGSTIGSATAHMCYSTDSSLSGAKSIEINLWNATTRMASIQDGNIYFRLAKDVTPTIAGQYTSVVTFALEAL